MNPMFKTLTILALLGFTTMAVFSFLGMGEHLSYHGRCLAELASNTTCPPESGPVPTSLFHINAFKTFSTGLVSSAVFGLVVLLVLTLLPLPIRLPTLSPPINYSNQVYFPLPVDFHLTNWLSRLENSPSAVSRRHPLS